MRILNLNILQKGISGITTATGGYLYEAATVALTKMGHSSGAILEIQGEFKDKFILSWKPPTDILTIRSWKNMSEAANYGAVGISLLLMKELSNFKSFEMGEIGTGIDYWMSKKKSIDENQIFPKREARLEISGILKEEKFNTINMRIGKKKKQMQLSDASLLEGWISIVEFSQPKSKIIKK